MPLNDLLKLIEQAFKLRDLRFYLRELWLRGLADQYLLSKQPSQLGFLPPEGVNDIDRDSPEESQTGINVRVFPALLQDGSEVLTATSTSGNPNAWSRADLDVFPGTSP